jgi:menaquinone-dependent protoporphyrinogen oxidase
MRVLIVHGSKLGGTAGIAEMLGESLRANGLEVDVRPAKGVRDIESYDAVVVGGALYAFRWHHDATRFVRRHRRVLKHKPVWLFSSGPLDDSALEKDIPPVRHVRNAMVQIGAIEHVTFGGALPEDVKGLIASKMAADHAGDWRNPEHIARWGRRIAEMLQAARVEQA